MTDGDVGPAVTSRLNAHAGAHTCARLRSHEREARRSFPCADISFLKTHTQAFFTFTYELYARVAAARSESEPPWKGTFLWVKKQPSRTPQSYAQLRNGLFICPPPPCYMDWLWHSPATAALQKNVYVVMSFLRRQLIKLSETFFGAFVHCNEENCQEMNQVVTQNRNKTRDFVYMFLKNCQPKQIKTFVFHL